ncbi:antibiotic biosynthesis monooxygenase [Nitrosarchaeum sp.]|uniref:antibiotic biosynthesis monooxygenase family protein n=1 Tax=Nitrosarchaeum sp. TaxID=2026886 RepID=UPI00261716E5|nr:antibiotic biosynthesis monooxygenase [Nitrosarchaeum sp.]
MELNWNNFMFVVISDVQIKSESLIIFKNWFSESNKTVSKFDGFVNRRLLETKDGKHRILVEFENLEKFSKMHQSPEHEKLHSMAASFMEKLPEPKFYTVVSQ